MKFQAKELGFIRIKNGKGVLKSVAIEKGQIFELPEGQPRAKWMVEVPATAPVGKSKEKEPERGSFKAK